MSNPNFNNKELLLEVNNVFIHPSAEVSEKATIGAGTRIWNHAQIREEAVLGENCIIGKDVYVDATVHLGNRVKTQNGVSIFRGVTCEDDVFLGPHMTFMNDKFPRAFINVFAVVPTLVKRGASIGSHATIICGVVIGEYAMVGAGCVVSRDVPERALVVGTPARIIGFICNNAHKLEFEERQIDGVRMKCERCSENYVIKNEIYDRMLGNVKAKR